MIKFLKMSSQINLNEKSLNYKAVSISDIAKFIAKYRKEIVLLDGGSLLKLPKVRSLVIKDSELLVGYDLEKNVKSLILQLRGYENQACVKQVLLEGDIKQLLKELDSSSFCKEFEGKYNSLAYYLKMS